MCIMTIVSVSKCYIKYHYGDIIPFAVLIPPAVFQMKQGIKVQMMVQNSGLKNGKNKE